MASLEKYRSESLKGQARKLGMEYFEEDEFGLRKLLSDFSLFNRGRRRRIHHIMFREEVMRKTYLFDYTYVIGKNNSRKYKRQTVMFINARELGLPEFSMKPENLWDRLTEWLKINKDIDFESHPEFSEKYFLQAEDEDLMRYLFNQEVLDFFTVQKNWYLEGLNYYLIIYSLNERFHPKILPSFLEMGDHLFELLKQNPESLKLDHPL